MTGKDQQHLVTYARRIGASDAVIVTTRDIVVEDRFAAFCRQPRCEQYGRSIRCPPHTAGPAGFQKWAAEHPRALFFKIDVPSATLFSNERRQIFQLLQETAAAIEHKALQTGFRKALSFAGGSCKAIFCQAHPDCAALTAPAQCRHPQVARPSMSGFGIDVAKLFATAGWAMQWEARHGDGTTTPMANVSGLVLLGERDDRLPTI
ncbi:MAG: DUF2284 domain-containing protein [Desulfatitalea sp.]|nr:DUF2284 domain-containing protein [Desulfatitalea sp.]